MAWGRFMEGVVGLDNLAAATGTPTHDRVWALLVAAIAITDREVALGVSREDWLAVCAHVHDEIRGALASGEQS